jgi:hypothetical protein
MNSLSNRSIKNMDGVSPYLQMTIIRAISISPVDFGVLETGGERTASMQYNIFKEGFSKCDGYEKLSYHQSGNALDKVPYIGGKYTWSNKQAFIDIYYAWREAEALLRKLNMIPDDIFFHHGLFWNWKDIDGDGIIEITDKLGWDAAHTEIRSYPQKNIPL